MISEALVREYLSKHGLDSTLKKFESEKPRSSSSISNRNALRKVVGMDKMAAKLKRRSEDTPLPSTLEMLVISQLTKLKVAAAAGGDSVGGEKERRVSVEDGMSRLSTVDNQRPTKPSFLAQPSPNAAVSAASPLPSAARPRTTAAFSANHESDEPPRKPRNMFAESAEPTRAHPTRSPVRPATTDMMVMEDFDEDFGEDLSTAPMFSTRPNQPPGAGFQDRHSRGGELPGAVAISPEEGRSVKMHLFGRMGAPASWKQGFFFSQERGLEYGLVQKEGGPCGILAGMQARVLQALAGGGRAPVLPNKGPLSPEQQRGALIEAIAACLIQAGAGQASLMTSSERSTSDFSLDQLLRCSKLVKVRSVAEAERAVSATLPLLMEEDGWGIIMFLFSLVLSHGGVDQVKKDMDEPDNTLMGMHGYCTQDLVNLILCGHAVTNVFDGIKTLDEHTTLKGIPAPSQIGFLSLFEWYKYIEVGDYYKNPQCAIWVVCCESHFTCMFSTDPQALKDNLPFDLYYYDGLANQNEVIKFTVTKSPTGGHTAKAGETIGSRGNTEGDLTPPLEFVIETRWPGVNVDWNGSDPIL